MQEEAVTGKPAGAAVKPEADAGDERPISQQVGQRIKVRRQALGLSLRKLGAKADLTASSLSQIEREERVVLLKGRMRIQLNEEVTAPEPGNALHYDASPPHLLTAIGDTEA